MLNADSWNCMMKIIKLRYHKEKFLFQRSELLHNDYNIFNQEVDDFSLGHETWFKIPKTINLKTSRRKDLSEPNSLLLVIKLLRLSCITDCLLVVNIKYFALIMNFYWVEMKLFSCSFLIYLQFIY